MLDEEFKKHLETTGVTDPETIHHMNEAWNAAIEEMRYDVKYDLFLDAELLDN